LKIRRQAISKSVMIGDVPIATREWGGGEGIATVQNAGDAKSPSFISA
jgi:hypothetical protein